MPQSKRVSLRKRHPNYRQNRPHRCRSTVRRRKRRRRPYQLGGQTKPRSRSSRRGRGRNTNPRGVNATKAVGSGVASAELTVVALIALKVVSVAIVIGIQPL